VGDYTSSQTPGAGYTGAQQPGTYANNAKPAATPPAPRAIVNEVRLHFYLPIPRGHQAFIDYVDFPWDKTDKGPYKSIGVALSLFDKEKKGIEDFKRSINVSGTIVVYMGHTRASCKTQFGEKPNQPAIGRNILKSWAPPL
jgi:hypothetical protein